MRYVYTRKKQLDKLPAIRDIQNLIDKNILKEDIPGAKRPSYSIVYDAEDLTRE